MLKVDTYHNICVEKSKSHRYLISLNKLHVFGLYINKMAMMFAVSRTQYILMLFVFKNCLTVKIHLSQYILAGDSP